MRALVSRAPNWKRTSKHCFVTRGRSIQTDDQIAARRESPLIAGTTSTLSLPTVAVGQTDDLTGIPLSGWAANRYSRRPALRCGRLL